MSRARKQLKPRENNEKQIYIFSEGETEVCYFKQLKHVKASHNLKISGNAEGQLSGRNKKKLKISQDRVYEIISNLKGNFNKRDIKKTKSKIFYLLDIDGYNRSSYGEGEIDFIKKNFQDNNITVLFSNKDIELWILLHLCEYKKEDGKYIEEILKKSGHDYLKGGKVCNVDFFQKIISENLETALMNAQKISEYQTISKKRTHIKNKNPYTEIHKIFDEIKF